ncbi:hypothetical protein LshimejAT787_1202350 [Lyophyllum shimeji]|uniref:Uncharacterized protein n=1 Tax=Lyophyllum shimeji TaxID=47721 RepID=A0A9P3PW79_LYOSH|nr:hypothetical protein LshimejAT787_1202350 [Lyophyllum shimeji]
MPSCYVYTFLHPTTRLFLLLISKIIQRTSNSKRIRDAEWESRWDLRAFGLIAGKEVHRTTAVWRNGPTSVEATSPPKDDCMHIFR